MYMWLYFERMTFWSKLLAFEASIVRPSLVLGRYIWHGLMSGVFEIDMGHIGLGVVHGLEHSSGQCQPHEIDSRSGRTAIANICIPMFTSNVLLLDNETTHDSELY